MGRRSSLSLSFSFSLLPGVTAIVAFISNSISQHRLAGCVRKVAGVASVTKVSFVLS
jgi:hypothetical protein